MLELSGKVAVVTGAGSGIGRAMALAFAAEGMSLAVVDIDKVGVDETADLITAAGAWPRTGCPATPATPATPWREAPRSH